MGKSEARLMPRNGSEIIRTIGHELKVNPPKILARTRRKKGKAAADRQRTAILLSKAREAGARIPHA